MHSGREGNAGAVVEHAIQAAVLRGLDRYTQAVSLRVRLCQRYGRNRHNFLKEASNFMIQNGFTICPRLL